MKATEASFLGFLGNKGQFVVPIYQRAYAWSKEQCQRLWDDIVRTGADDNAASHFVGAVVFVHGGAYQATLAPKLMVIDGQQRIATVLLLIKALADAAEERPDELEQTAALFRDYYLFNPHQKADLRYKLMLTLRDRATLVSLLDGTPMPERPSERVIENVSFFEERLRDVDLGVVMRGLERLMIVEVSLEWGRDNPQLIFESLNSTGVDLSQADLVRNYVLMGQTPDVQDKLFNAYWYQMESQFERSGRAAFDDFLRDYLTLETRTIPRKDRVYDAFKAFVHASGEGMEQIVATLHHRAGLYARMTLGVEKDPVLRERFADLQELEVDVAYPVLLGVFVDFDAGTIGRDEFAQVLSIVESYVFRRAVCDIPTNTLNSTFATLHGRIDPEVYVHSLSTYMYSMGGSRVFPEDRAFIEALATRNVYHFRRRRYLLRKLENDGRKEPVDIDAYSIEHVMPQNPELPPWWREELGHEWEEVHETHLHRLGNLTYTGYNSELSDRPFREKQEVEGGFKESPLRLNRYPAKATRWSKEQIDERGMELAQQAANIWPFLPLPPAVLEQYKRFRVTDIDDEGENGGSSRNRHGLARSLVERVQEAMPDIVFDERKRVVHFMADGKFASVIPWQGGLTLTLDLELEQVKDPLNLCARRAEHGTWGVGRTQAYLTAHSHVAYGVDLVRQAYEGRGRTGSSDRAGGGVRDA